MIEKIIDIPYVEFAAIEDELWVWYLALHVIYARFSIVRQIFDAINGSKIEAKKKKKKNQYCVNSTPSECIFAVRQLREIMRYTLLPYFLIHSRICSDALFMCGMCSRCHLAANNANDHSNYSAEYNSLHLQTISAFIHANGLMLVVVCCSRDFDAIVKKKEDKLD